MRGPRDRIDRQTRQDRFLRIVGAEPGDEIEIDLACVLAVASVGAADDLDGAPTRNLSLYLSTGRTVDTRATAADVAEILATWRTQRRGGPR